MAAAVLAALLPSAAPAASGLRPPAKASVSRATTDSITLRWKDRSRRESRYELSWQAAGGESHERRLRRNGERARIGKLDSGTVYDLELAACRRKRCEPARGQLSGATLLAPFGGPHPDPGCDVFPAADAFNQPVAGAPRHPRSDAIIDRILADGGDSLHPDFGSNPAYGIPYVVVPAGQPEVPIRFTAYGDESDPGPYPVPPGAPVEGGSDADGDRHVLVVRRPATSGGSCELFELYRAFERAGGRGWRADSAAFFDLGAPLAGQRPAGWTSADAAGLPVFPGLVTREEVDSGLIDHAIRITFEETRAGYFSPATHSASDSCDPDRPSMGMRLRLRAGYDISGIDGDAGVIARALRDYGAIVADNGSNFYISGSTDSRWRDSNLNQLKEIPGTAFEVVAPGSAEVSDC